MCPAVTSLITIRLQDHPHTPRNVRMIRVSAILLGASGLVAAYGEDSPFGKAKEVLELNCVECHTPE